MTTVNPLGTAPSPLIPTDTTDAGEIVVLGRDLCKVLDLGNAAAVKRRLDDADKGLTRINTPGGDQNVGIVNESGMYDVVLRSDKPQAKEFRRSITSEVLPGLSLTAPPQRSVTIAFEGVR